MNILPNMRSRFCLFSILAVLLTATFSQIKERGDSFSYLEVYQRLDQIYLAAEKLSLHPDYDEKMEAREAAMNQQALEGFLSIAPLIEKSGNDSLSFHCWFKIGTLQHYFDSLYAALQSYRKAIRLGSSLPALPDSFLFKPHLYFGSVFYTTNQFDSALANYKKAEEIANRHTIPLHGTNRLFNSLGALFHETGNYNQASNYFEKAISVLPKNEPSYRDLLINYEINLASALTRLERFNEAAAIYSSILPTNVNRNEILHNIGTTFAGRGLFADALEYYRLADYSNNRTIRLYNDMASAFLQLRKYDSARIVLEKAVAENARWNGTKKNSPHGLTLKLYGDLLAEQNDLHAALEKYQQAIMQFDKAFNAKEAGLNPQDFGVVFSYIPLFHTLAAKAQVLESLYETQKNSKVLEASLNTWKSAFDLADHVEQTYDSDEARLFLNKIKYLVHSKPIDVSLALFRISDNPSYLEDAYTFDQRNKGSILSFNVHESSLRNTPGAAPLFAQQSYLRSAITRLTLRASQITDSVQLQKTDSAIRDYEIQLGKLQEKITADPAYANKLGAARIPSIKELQRSLDNSTAIISYHLSEKDVLSILITKSKIHYQSIGLSPAFFSSIDSLRNSLQVLSAGAKYQGGSPASALYSWLIAPIRIRLAGIDRLVIIPDDELNYLPFEALQDTEGKYLVELYSVQYQSSTALLGKLQKNTAENNILALAPFSSVGFENANPPLSRLPHSGEEVENINGFVLKDREATKQRFLAQANRFKIIHLATHATVSNESPSQSFIAFYPGGDSRLYAGEVYDLRLDSVSLVILSACETGSGNLVRGEGLMSLSRAFRYAGCPNIIPSLWKAEDKTTAYLSKRLHVYLSKGFSRDKALQQAKIDLIRSPDIDPRYKTPNYWAHLVYIGEYEGINPFKPIWAIAGVAIASLLLIILLFKRKKISRK